MCNSFPIAFLVTLALLYHEGDTRFWDEVEIEIPNDFPTEQHTDCEIMEKAQAKLDSLPKAPVYDYCALMFYEDIYEDTIKGE